MACAIGLSRILREDRATKDGASGKVADFVVVTDIKRAGAINQNGI